jgi:protoheme IX farnesyltransferase
MIADLLALAKPRIAAMVGVATALGAVIAAEDGRVPDGLGSAALAATLAAAGTAALNQWLERAADARMARTRTRPLPAGRLRPAAAAALGVAAVAGGVAWMALAANATAAALVAAAALGYLACYTPLKGRTAACVWVGALPGALPPLIGAAVATGRLTPTGLALFAWIVAWQIPHVAALAALHRADYAGVGWRMDPLGPLAGAARSLALATGAATTVALSLVATGFGGGGLASAITVASLGLAFALAVGRFAWAPDRAGARLAFRASVAYLPAVLAVLALGSAAP